MYGFFGQKIKLHVLFYFVRFCTCYGIFDVSKIIFEPRRSILTKQEIQEARCWTPNSNFHLSQKSKKTCMITNVCIKITTNAHLYDYECANLHD